MVFYLDGLALSTGVLNSVTSTDGKVTANLNYHSDPLGFRDFGVSPTLSVLASDTGANPSPAGNDAAPWTSYDQIPMQKYAWNGNGLLQGVYAAVAKDDKVTNVDVHDLLVYRMFDESGNILAEFDGMQMLQMSSRGLTAGSTTSLTAIKLPRLVNFASGITYERDEIHLNVGLGSFASLDLITRYPNLNATSPKTITNILQTRKELRISDHVGSTSIVIDIDSKKIVERNASEPYGLERGIPLISNSVIPQYTAQGKRADGQLYQNSQGNMRDNWPTQGFEAVGSNPNEMQGMRNSEHFALGKFSAQTGLHSMGVRSFDAARGMWISPDLAVGQSLEMMVRSEQEGNLFQYAANNPLSNNDPTGMNSNDAPVVHTTGDGGDGGTTTTSDNNNSGGSAGAWEVCWNSNVNVPVGDAYDLTYNQIANVYSHDTQRWGSANIIKPAQDFVSSVGDIVNSTFNSIGDAIANFCGWGGGGGGGAQTKPGYTVAQISSTLGNSFGSGWPNVINSAYVSYQESPTAQAVVRAVSDFGVAASAILAAPETGGESLIVADRFAVIEGYGASSEIKVIGRLEDTNVAKE